MLLCYLQETLANILELFASNVLEVNQYTITVVDVGCTRSSVILRVDCKTMRIIGADNAQVKLEFMMAHKLVEHVMIDGASLETVEKFCYLGNMISAGGGAEESVIARTRSG